MDSSELLLDEYCEKADFIFHLAGVNRPIDQNDFMIGNFGFTSILLNKLVKFGNKCPIVLSSSIQAELENTYGKSKKAGEDLLLEYGIKHNVKVLIYRFPNVFGKWCKPNYNSAIATFCHNIAHNLPVIVNDPNVDMNLVYIDDLVKELVDSLNGYEHKHNDKNFCYVPTSYKIKLGEVVKKIYEFKEIRENNTIPDMSDEFTKKIFSTYLSYLPDNSFNYDLKMNIDQRGSFTEFIKTLNHGQISVNISKPGIVKGNHWHNTKTEKFLVVSGSGVIRFRKAYNDKIIEYFVNGSKLEVVDIPPGYTHNIENIGDTDLVTIMWANELFDINNPDTFYMEV